MKILLYIFSFIFIVFGVWQLYRAFSNKKYENLETDILVSFNKIKFQVYKEYTKASLSFDSKTISNANGKFSILANYIFGGNKENQQISMTSPVLYNIKNESTFSFIMPSSYKKKTLPLPKNNSIFFNTEYNQCVASIEFGGFVNDQICNIKHKELKDFLISKEITFKNDFIIAVYNSPYDLINRKNEIWIEVNQEELREKLGI